ncbi:MAG: hypothetical protein JNL34_01790 [Anaerolineae bacterium]|nr:hypothetical protein [Anaerolineae bacterium]
MFPKALAVFMVSGLLLFGGGIVHAISGSTLISYVFSCTDIAVTYTDVLFDRDNTGAGAEAYTLIITDGAGNTLLSFSDARAIGDTITGQTESFAFAIPPARNPIHVHLYSHAGNGYPQQTIFDFTGDSPCLPSSATSCDIGAPAGSVLSTLNHDTPAYYAADPGTATGFNIPAGHWFTYEVSGDFTHLWVTCGANPVWVATSALN